MAFLENKNIAEKFLIGMMILAVPVAIGAVIVIGVQESSRERADKTSRQSSKPVASVPTSPKPAQKPYWETLPKDLEKYVPAICDDVRLVEWTPSFWMQRQMDRVNDHVRALDFSPKERRQLTYAGWGCIGTKSLKDETAQEYGVKVYKFTTENASQFKL